MPEDQNSSFFTNLDDLKNSLTDDQTDQHVLDLGKNSQMERDETQWFSEEYEGQLSVDVYQTEDDIMVKSTIAGVKPDELEIYLHNDLLTIRGKREQTVEEKGADYFYKECYWGGFSRSIILPVEVQPDKVEASFKNGILTIVLPKSKKSKLINVKIKEE